MNKTYVEITSSAVNIFTKTRKESRSCWSKACFALPPKDDLLQCAKALPSSVLVANTRQVAIRVADISNRHEMSDSAISLPQKLWQMRMNIPGLNGLGDAEKWALVKSVFPICDIMNEKTHIFDGTVFTNKEGASRFLITALPIKEAEKIGDIGVNLLGNVHRIKRLDTVEHFIFCHYAQKTTEALMVVFPQENGVRVLFLADGMPRSARNVSNDPEFRTAELLNYWQSNETITPKKAIVLNDGLDLEWLYEFFDKHNVAVEKETYCFSNFI